MAAKQHHPYFQKLYLLLSVIVGDLVAVVSTWGVGVALCHWVHVCSSFLKDNVQMLFISQILSSLLKLAKSFDTVISIQSLDLPTMMFLDKAQIQVISSPRASLYYVKEGCLNHN